MTDSPDLKTEDVAWLEAAKDAGSSPYCLEHNARIDRILSALTPAAGGWVLPADPPEEWIEAMAMAHENSPCMDIIGPMEDAYRALREAMASPPPHREGVG